MKRYTTAEQLKKFCHPFFLLKKKAFLMSLQVSSRPLYSIITTLFLAKIVSYIENPNKELFFSYIVAYIIFVFLYQIYNASMRNRFASFQWAFIKMQYNTYKEKYIKLDSNKTELVGTGKMLSIIEKWIDTWVNLTLESMVYGASAVVNLVFVTYLLTQITWYFPIMLYIFLAIVLSIAGKLGKWGDIWREKRNDLRDEATRHNVRILMSKFEILLHDKIDSEHQAYKKVVDEMEYYDKKKNFYEHWSFNAPSIMLALITVSLFVLLGYKFFYQNTVQYADIVLYLWLISSLEMGVRDAVTLYKSFIQSFQRVEKLWSTFENIPEIVWYDVWDDFVLQKGDIVFEDVWLHYENTEVLKNLTLKIQWGKKTALVWISWAGKSTIIKLIAWYIHCDEWRILIDNQALPNQHSIDQQTVSLKSYYKHIWYLTQEPSVFDGTIYENLVYALDYEPTKEMVENAIRQAQCQFIDSFAKGLDTEIWEKWIRLSWWQRQRLAIAKVFLKNPSIVLLDEPTSALDSLSEEGITQALDSLFQWRTVVIIAHRLQTVKKADDIIVLENGIVIERGTHGELVAKWWQYAKMLELQSGF